MVTNVREIDTDGDNKTAEKDKQIVESLKTGKTLKQIKEETKKKDELKTDKMAGLGKKKLAELQVKGEPKDVKGLSQIDDTIILEITPEMAETLVTGILDFIAFIAPEKFNEPTSKHAAILKQPAYIVIQRWMPKLDILKYLPEIVLATAFMTVLKDMKKKEVKT